MFFAHLPSELFELRFFVLSVALYHVKRRTAVASVKLYMDDSVGWSKARPLSIPAVKRLLPTPAADPCPARSDLAAGSIDLLARSTYPAARRRSSGEQGGEQGGCRIDGGLEGGV